MVARYGAIVNTIAIDSVLATHGGAITMSNLPAGSATMVNPGAVYFAFMRVRNSASPLARPRIIPILSFADLRATSSASVNAVLP